MGTVDIRRLDMTLLLVFGELMRERKLTRVAEKLGLTQSTISHSLRRLRDAFGDDLFLRRANGVEPTSRAHELEPTIREIIELARKALDRTVEFTPGTASGVVRISMPDHHCALMTGPLLDIFRRQAPGLKMSIRPQVRRQALDALAANETDLALGYLWRVQEGMRARLLFEDTHVVVARMDHPVIHGTIDLDGFLAADHVLVSLGGDLEGIADRALARRGLKRRLAGAIPYFLPALATVARTDLIATLPRRHAEAFATSFRLQVLAPPIELNPYRVSAVWHERNATNQLIAWVVEQLVGITSQSS
jgi:DNA-binding transcriptional LysR family regulator